MQQRNAYGNQDSLDDESIDDQGPTDEARPITFQSSSSQLRVLSFSGGFLGSHLFLLILC